jgi:hypothetical protein
MRTLVLIFLVCFYCEAAFAELGAAASYLGGQQSVTKKQTINGATLQNYHVTETVLVSGTRVREYILGSGTVFAVSWNGPFLPNLQSILGKHFDTMVTEAGKVSRAGNSQLRISRPEVSIFSGGHMGAYEGHAWISQDFPAGFSVQDIQ